MEVANVFCNVCQKQTRHNIKAIISYGDLSEHESDGETYFNHEGHTDYQLVECDFCRKSDSISFRVAKTKEGYNGDDDYSVTTEVNIYPKRDEESVVENGVKFLPNKSINDLPAHLRKMYEEVVKAYEYNLPILCASGLRSLVEGLCADCESSGKVQKSNGTANLGTRIRELGVRGVITRELATALRTHKQLGNDAVHELIPSNKEELKLAIELIETAFDNIFSVTRRHFDLSDKMTKRIAK